MDAPAAGAPPLPLDPTTCPLCGHDDGEPAAVGRDFSFDTSPDSFLALECRACGLVYLNPAPAPAARTQIYPDAYFASDRGPDQGRALRAAAGRALACCAGLPAAARVLELGYGAQLHLPEIRRSGASGWTGDVVTPHPALLDAARQAGLGALPGMVGGVHGAEPYDAVLALHALEHCAAPLEELRGLRPLLGRGGRVVIVCHNAESAVSRRFRGRHWAGYDFPRHRVLFGPRSLRALAERADFAVERVRPVRYPRMWSRSAANFLNDWSAPGWMSRQARDGTVVAAPLAAVAEAASGRGLRSGWLEAVLIRQDERP